MNSTPIGTGFSSSPNSPDYMDMGSKEILQQQAANKFLQGSPINPGVILTKDSLQVPLEVQFGITDERANSSNPTLMPLIRTRYVEDRTTEDTSLGFYQERRAKLSDGLKQKLDANDEAIRTGQFDLIDQDVLALDMSLKFEANLMALANGLSVPSSGHESLLIGAQQYLAMPEAVKSEMISYGSKVVHFLDQHLSQIGSNDPSYDILLNASNQIKEALTLLK